MKQHRGTETDLYGNLIYVRVMLHISEKRINHSLTIQYIAGVTGYLYGNTRNGISTTPPIENQAQAD